MIPLLIVSNDTKEVKKYLKNILPENSYLFEIEPENKEYSIKEMKNLIKEANIFHIENRIYYLKNFQNSSIEVQNSLLKQLEEPPKNSLFVFSVDSENKLLPTIISRLKIIYLKKKNITGFAMKEKIEIENILDGKNALLSTDISISLDQIMLFFKQRLKHDKNAIKILKECFKLKFLQENNNLNLQLTLDHLLILISKTYKIKL